MQWCHLALCGRILQVKIIKVCFVCKMQWQVCGSIMIYLGWNFESSYSVICKKKQQWLESPPTIVTTVSLGPSSVHWTWSLLELFKSLGLWRNFWQLSFVLWLSRCIYCQRAIKLKKSITNKDNCLSYLRSTKQLKLKLTLTGHKIQFMW